LLRLRLHIFSQANDLKDSYSSIKSLSVLLEDSNTNLKSADEYIRLLRPELLSLAAGARYQQDEARMALAREMEAPQ
jgi:hypothetical protein